MNKFVIKFSSSNLFFSTGTLVALQGLQIRKSSLMKYSIGAVVALLLSVLIYSCKKDYLSVPVLITSPITEISFNMATSGGSISNEGGSPILERGICWNTHGNPSISDSKSVASINLREFTGSMTGLSMNTKYCVRSYATNSAGTGYGNQISFTTNKINIPELTAEVLSISVNAFNIRVIISKDGGDSVSSRGICFSVFPNPTTSNTTILNGIGSGSFICKVMGVEPKTVYYVRSFATNRAGTSYGNELIIKTLNELIDIDGNSYNVVSIGAQTWMAENLRVTHYQNGDNIPLVVSQVQWDTLHTGAYCTYENTVDQNNITTFGRLYNWHAASDIRNLAPSGWHIPTDSDWKTLVAYVGGDSIAGRILRESGTSHWNISNIQGEDIYGFRALPGGCRGYYAFFTAIGKFGLWWSSTEFDSTAAWEWDMYCQSSRCKGFVAGKSAGYSIRCIKDN